MGIVIAWLRASDAALDRCHATGTTALLVHADAEAIALVQRCEDRGLSVPGDLSVVAYDDAGNVSPPTTVDVGQPGEAADRAWVTTDAGPALCGRTGELAAQRLGCTVLTRKGWRFAGRRYQSLARDGRHVVFAFPTDVGPSEA